MVKLLAVACNSIVESLLEAEVTKESNRRYQHYELSMGPIGVAG